MVLAKEGYPDQPEEFGKISVSETPRPPLLELRLAEKLLQLTEREPQREELSQLPPTKQRQRPKQCFPLRLKQPQHPQGQRFKQQR